MISLKLRHEWRKSLWAREVARRRPRFQSHLSDEVGAMCRRLGVSPSFLSFVYSTTNLGDEIQTIAQLGFIPPECRIAAIDREMTNAYRGDPRLLISNGWFLHNLAAWPPSDAIDPVFISVHIADRHLLTPSNIAYFRRHAAIGCRDMATVRMLREAGVEAYFSGCLTLTLRNPYSQAERNLGVVICDADSDVATAYPPTARTLLKRLVPEDVRAGALLVQHECQPSDRFDYAGKMRMAERLLDTYARARLVITTRLHCALPCLALGTPVVFLHNEYDTDPRFDGLREVLRGYGPDAREIAMDWKAPQATDISTLRGAIERRVVTAIEGKLATLGRSARAFH